MPRERTERGKRYAATSARLAEAGLIPSEIFVSGRKKGRGEFSQGPVPKAIRSSYATDDGKRVGTTSAGDQVSLDDLIQYATHTPEFSDKYLGGKRNFSDIDKAGDFIDWAFEKSGSFDPERDSASCPKTCHIEKIEYADRWQLLRVTFKINSSVVVYTRVPSGVFELLRHHAERGTTGTGVDGKEHTLVGMAFWSYVRIRGTRHGVQYPAFYYDGRPTARGSVGARTEAETGRARVGTQRTGDDGMPISDAGKGGMKASLYKPMQFLDREEPFSADEMREISRAAKGLKDVEGTVAFALTHGPEDERIERGRELAKEMIDTFLGSSRISQSMKDKLKEAGRIGHRDDIPGEALFDMERLLYSERLWPLSARGPRRRRDTAPADEY